MNQPKFVDARTNKAVIIIMNLSKDSSVAGTVGSYPARDSAARAARSSTSSRKEQTRIADTHRTHFDDVLASAENECNYCIHDDVEPKEGGRQPTADSRTGRKSEKREKK